MPNLQNNMLSPEPSRASFGEEIFLTPACSGITVLSKVEKEKNENENKTGVEEIMTRGCMESGKEAGPEG